MSNITFSQIDSKNEFLTSQDLADIGLFPSANAVYLARKRGISPDFIKLGARVLYPKSCVIEFIKSSLKAGRSEVTDSDEDIDSYGNHEQ